MKTMTVPDAFTTTARRKLASFVDYADAQRAVDRLSDAGFPVANVSIVWNRLRHIERVVGRRTVGRAAVEGAASGAWFGGIIGLLLLLFVELDPDVSGWGLVLSYAVVGAIVGAIFLAVAHWMRRGARDFSSVGSLDAEEYEVWVSAEHYDDAIAVLGQAS